MSISRCVTRRTCGQRRDEPQLTQFRAIWQLRSTSTEKNAYVYSDCATRLGHLQRKKRTAVLASGDPRQRRRHHNATLRPIAIDGVSESARDWYRDAPPRFGGEHSGRAASRRNPVLRTRHLEPRADHIGLERADGDSRSPAIVLRITGAADQQLDSDVRVVE